MQMKTLAALLMGTLLGTALLPAGFAQDNEPRGDGRGAREQSGDGMRGSRGGMGRGMRTEAPARMLGNLDSDDDGRISRDEFVDARARQTERLFERRDVDGDGLLTAGETDRPARDERPGPPRGRGRMDPAVAQTCIAPDADPEALSAGRGGGLATLVADADSNGDGALSLSELSSAAATGAASRFDLLDGDNDGFVTEAELTAVADAAQTRRQEMRECIRSATGTPD
jgi:hypothetical protein